MTDNHSQFEDALQTFERVSENRLERAKQWHAEGGKVLAYVGNSIPLELIHAAGFFPLHMSGLAGAETPLADQYLEPAFDPWSRSIFNRLLAGDYSFVSGLVLPRTHDSHQRLYYYLCELERNHARSNLPTTYLLNLLQTPRSSTQRYNLDRFREFKAFLENLNGVTVTSDQLQASVELFNQLRQSLLAFNGLRADGVVASELAYQVYATLQSIPAQEMLPLLEVLCTRLASSKNRTANRALVIAGNGVDHPGLHNFFEQQGFTIVGDYHSLGNHFLGTGLVNTQGDLLESLVDHYQNHSKSGRSFTAAADDLLSFAQAQKASAVLFHYLLKEEALSWHYPKQQAALANAGLHTALLSDQPYELDYAALGSAALKLR